MDIAFDTLAYAKKLKSAGVSEAEAEIHAEALAHIVDEKLAKKRDLENTRLALANDIKELKLELTIRMGFMLAANITIIVALLKLL